MQDRRTLRIVTVMVAGALLTQVAGTSGAPGRAMRAEEATATRHSASAVAAAPAALTAPRAMAGAGGLGSSSASAIVLPRRAVIPDPLPAKVVVTVRVADETFRLLARGDDVRNAYELLEGTSLANIPVAKVVYGDPGVNRPWSWHLDPDTLEWAEVAVEVCDGRPSDVEAHAITDDHYCPWGAEVIDVRPLLPDSSTSREAPPRD